MFNAVDKLRDGLLLTRAWISLGAIDLALRRHGYESVLSAIEQEPADADRIVSMHDIRRAQRYSRRLNEAAHIHVIRARCLHRSLALHQWLRREGLPSQLRIGVRTADGALFAHAWVELSGYPVNDVPSSLKSFVPLTQRGNDDDRQLPERRYRSGVPSEGGRAIRMDRRARDRP